MAIKYKKTAGGIALVSASLLAMIGGFEGREHEVYRDIVGVPTVCDGITGEDVIDGKVYTDAECDALSSKHIQKHGEKVLSCVTVTLNQHQYEAFTSLAYNVGTGNFCNSGLKKTPPQKYLIDLLNDGNYTAACNRIMSYNKVKKLARGGYVFVPVQGLTNRRTKERDLCLKPVPAPILERAIA